MTEKKTKMRCSKCGEIGTIREIVYGLPAPNFDFKRYVSGGCSVILDGPNLACTKCGWEGLSGSSSDF
jgi:predicted RNA-binding Zn-ribbon protein involved in translation (DUF1610 family)